MTDKIIMYSKNFHGTYSPYRVIMLENITGRYDVSFETLNKSGESKKCPELSYYTVNNSFERAADAFIDAVTTELYCKNENR